VAPGPARWFSDYAAQVEIDRARAEVVRLGREEWTAKLHGGTTDFLIAYLRSGKFAYGESEQARSLLIKIGPPAIPALENGVRRGDRQMKQSCQECIDAIKAPGGKDH